MATRFLPPTADRDANGRAASGKSAPSCGIPPELERFGEFADSSPR